MKEMTVLAHIDLHLGADDFLEAQGEAFRRSGIKEAALWALQEARRLILPAMSYAWVPVDRVDDRRAWISGVRFSLGKHADLLAPARDAFVAVVTIGSRLEEEARALGADGRALESFVLGEAGVFAVGLLIQRAHRVVEEEAARRSWGVGAELAPGQLAGWGIEEQKLVCRLVDTAAIGVTVTGTGMLVPQKSASLMVGIGPGYASAEVRTPCEYCDVRDTCRWRH
jgi:hypothetical protein